MKFAYWRYLAAVALAFLALGSAPAAWAQTYVVQVNASPDLGNVIPDTSATTTFTFSPAGAVTKSGNGVRKSSNLVRAQITLVCTGTGNLCANGIAVKIGSIGVQTGKAGPLTNFTATAISGTISAASGTNPRTFTITPVSKSTNASFYVGADFPITGSSTGTVGAASTQFYVYAAPTTPTTGSTVTAIANTYRGATISGTPLAFGKVGRPTSGTSTVTIDPSSATSRTMTGASGATGVYSRATFTVTGENSLAITVTQDSSLTMNRVAGGGSITVALTHTAFPTVLGTGGTTGSQGTATFYTGGSFSVTPSTALGDYLGSYNTMVSYN